MVATHLNRHTKRSDSRIDRRIGLLGGTFDPIHYGHIAVAQRFINCLDLTELVLLPAGQPWQKKGVSSAHHRLAMTQLAAKELETWLDAPPQLEKLGQPHVAVRVAVDELERPGPSYMVDTLATYREQLGDAASLTLIIGDDQFAHLDSWHAWHRLFDYAHIGVAYRIGYKEDAKNACTVNTMLKSRITGAVDIQTHAKGLIFEDVVKMPNISSTQLRQAIMANNRCASDLEEWVPPAVLNYIFEHHLYQTYPPQPMDLHGYSHA